MIKENKVLNLALLEPGTKLTIETRKSFYQIKILKGKEIVISGGMTSEGDIRFPSEVSAVFTTNYLKENMNMKVKLIETNQLLITSDIKNVEIEASNGSWFYSMDWNK